MAVRLLSYVSLLLEQIIRSEKLKAGDGLPAVLPLVIHNGKRPWRAPRDLRRLFVPLPGELRRRLPQLTYHVLDLGRLELDLPDLARNHLATAFQIETCEDATDVPWMVTRLGGLLPPEDPDLQRTYTAWLLPLLRRNFPGIRFPEIMGREGTPMSIFDENMREWRKRQRQEARQEGRQEGLVEGMRRVLLRQMSLRFGRLPQDVRRRVEQVTSVQELEKLTRRVLRAKTLQEMGLG